MNIGQYNTLTVRLNGLDGYMLEGEGTGERVLLPRAEATKDIAVGQQVRVFVYLDASHGPLATTRIPKATIGQCAYLEVVEVNEVGAFLDWGLSKDLFVPFGQQYSKMRPGRSYTVYVYLDNTGRIAATPKLDTYLSEDGRGFNVGDAVDLLIWERTKLGFKAIINHTHLGMLFDSEVLGALSTGESVQGYVAEVRADHKINLTLQRHDAAARDKLQDQILAYLQANEGTSTLTDRSSPEEIFKIFGVSKKSFKRALGALYRDKKIEVQAELIGLL